MYHYCLLLGISTVGFLNLKKKIYLGRYFAFLSALFYFTVTLFPFNNFYETYFEIYKYYCYLTVMFR